MTIEERREREKQQMKELILETAAQIIVAEGYEKLSIRKIANKIEYSPAIIYHYFSNKNEILSQVLRKGYQKLLSALSTGQEPSASPQERLKTLTRNYIEAALRSPDEFLAVQLNGTPEILGFTSYLFEHAAETKPALTMLSQAVRAVAGEQLSAAEIEMTAQIIAASTLGIVTRMILEKEIGEERKNSLIEHFTDAVVRMASSRPECVDTKGDKNI